jgi:CRP-like cAMP-binding protein
MPTHLRVAVLQEIGKQARETLPLFQGFGNECVGFLMTRLQRLFFFQGEQIYRRGDAASEAFFIVSGQVVLHAVRRESACAKGEADAEDAVPPTVAGAGDVFGEPALFPKLMPPFRAETAVAQNTVVAFSLSVDALAEVAGHYPALGERLEELCMLRLADRQHNGLSEPNRAKARVNAQPCRLRALVAQLQRALLHRWEREVLVPASGPDGSRVLSLFTARGSGRGDGRVRLVGVSCVMTGRGELLCVEHSPAGVAGERPLSLGFYVPGQSSFRVLTQDESIAQTAGSSAAAGAPHGCSLIVFCAIKASTVPDVTVAESATTRPRFEAGQENRRQDIAEESNSEREEVLLYTWLKEDFEALMGTINELCG